jgi:hypothetical protein
MQGEKKPFGEDAEYSDWDDRSPLSACLANDRKPVIWPF